LAGFARGLGKIGIGIVQRQPTAGQVSGKDEAGEINIVAAPQKYQQASEQLQHGNNLVKAMNDRSEPVFELKCSLRVCQSANGIAYSRPRLANCKLRSSVHLPRW